MALTQGILQPLSVNTGVGVHEVSPASAIHVYPNPASSSITLQYFAPIAGILTYTLLDGLGKTILQRQENVIAGFNTMRINIAALPAATYLLQVTGTEEEKSGATFKIEKIN